jgi:single-strand DNA-binding protein
MYQSFTAIGRLGRDPEMKYLPTGDPVTSFSIAVDKKWTKDGQKMSKTMWVRVQVFGKMSEACNTYLSKGKLVFVEGELSFDDKTGAPKTFQKQDGTTGTGFEIVASKVQFLSPKDDEPAA